MLGVAGSLSMTSSTTLYSSLACRCLDQWELCDHGTECCTTPLTISDSFVILATSISVQNFLSSIHQLVSPQHVVSKLC